jgi:hypothetical protein
VETEAYEGVGRGSGPPHAFEQALSANRN